MRKFILLCLGVAMALTASADFKALEFAQTDGTVITVKTEGLILTPQDGNLDIANTAGEKVTLQISSINYMQFVEESAGIESVAFDLEGNVTVYNLQGVREGEFSSAFEASRKLSPGIYLVRDNSGRTLKIIVK